MPFTESTGSEHNEVAKMRDSQRDESVADIVSAYVSNNPVPISNLPDLIQDVAQSLSQINDASLPERQNPDASAVPVKNSIQHDHIMCLECGRPFKTLRRHLTVVHGMSSHEYRTKWSLPSGYPMVAPAYSEVRSRLAKTMGLGRSSAGS